MIPQITEVKISEHGDNELDDIPDDLHFVLKADSDTKLSTITERRKNISLTIKPMKSKIRKFNSLPESMRLLNEMKNKTCSYNHCSNPGNGREVEYIFVRPKFTTSMKNKKEFSIHSCLDSIGIFQINIGEVLKECKF